MASLVSLGREEPPHASNETMLLAYPHGLVERFDPAGRFVKPGDIVNGYVVDHFELDESVGAIVAVLRRPFGIPG